ncbi:MAG: TonB-dependent receptor [Sphingobacteriaceae bacterium]|nr:MAG: TonB-dependent receptor [Sphingobacteriaceae bacterium]
MRKILRILLLCTFFLWVKTNAVFAQQKVVKGTITDEKGLTLPGVSVRVKGTTIGLQTGLDGKYSITVPSETATLVFTSIGYTPRELTANLQTLNVVMKEQTSSLNEVVVLAFGTQKKVNVTGAVSTITGKDLVSTPVSNISNALVGSAPGISALQTSGEPGQNAAQIRIRGVATFAGNSNPLIVIDGIEQAAERPYDQLNAMDANEIAGISVLKDAASTAVYGIRGANGVIIVTTKRGKAGKPVISLSSNFGFTKATNLQQGVSSYEYAVMRNEAINTSINSLGNASYSAFLFNADDLWKFQNNRDYTPAQVAAMTNLTDAQKAQLNASPSLYYGSHDLFKEQFGGVGPQQQYNLNISGGTEKVKYFTSLGYFSQGSIMNNTSYAGANTSSTFNRYNFRSNFDIQAAKTLQISVSVAGQFGNTQGPGGNSYDPYNLGSRYKLIEQYIYDGNPFITPGIIDGHLVNGFAGVAGSADNPLGIKTGSSIGNQNAVYNLLVSGTQSIYSTLLSNTIRATHTMDYLTQGLTVHATASYDDNYNKVVVYNPSLPVYTIRRDASNPNNYQFYGGATGANTFNSNPGGNYTWHKTYFDAGLDYNRTFGNHTLTGLILGKASLYSIPTDLTNTNTPSGIMGLVARATYNYKERYLAEFDMGYNGTEQFIEGRRFGFFPAYSLGWILTNESFFHKNDVVTFLKVRGSYGQVGNDQLSVNNAVRRYLYLPNTYNQNQTNTNNSQGYYLGNSNGSVQNAYYAGTNEGAIGNPNVTWERAKKTDIGLDARLLKDKLTLTVDVFKEDRDNILTTLGTIPTTYGVPSASVPPVNVGKTTNHGYEVSLGYNNRVGDFAYSVNGAVSYAKNKIIYRAEAPNPYYWQNAAGYPIGQYKGLISDGFFNSSQELANRPYNTFTSNQAALGDIRYKDINGDSKIDNKDQVPIGFSNLPQYAFNLRINLSYKGFDISTLFIGTAKGSYYLNSGLTIPFFKSAGNAWKWEYDGRWTPEKAATGAQITYPRSSIDGNSSTNNYLTSNFWLISNNFKRFKNAEIGYTFPSYSFLKSAKISSLRIYANGNNLFTWDNPLKKYGIDPETTDNNTAYIYPITRVFTFGANVRF